MKRALLLFPDRDLANEISDLLLLRGIDCVTQTRQMRTGKAIEKTKLFNLNAILISEKVVSSQLAVFCQNIRKTNSSLAILVSFHQPNSDLEEELFDIGVDDVVPESASAGSIAKRIMVRMQTRQMFLGSDNVVGKAIVDSKSFQILAEGKTMPIRANCKTVNFVWI